MCGHQDVKTSTACPGYRFETNWVKAHSKYGRRSVDGGVSEVTDGELNLSFMPRVRNLLAKFCEILVYKVIASHSRKPKIRNMNPKFSKLAKSGPELSQK